MLNRKCSLRLALILGALSAFSLFADDKEESLWGYADPSADLCVYINTKQAEKAMEKNLWNRIQQDKNEAISKKSKGQLFSTKDRDMELMANLRIVTMEPFCGSVDGIANISGNLQGDIDKLMETMKSNNGIDTQMSKQNDMDFYAIAIPGTEGLSGIDCVFVPVTPNQIQFRVNINSQDAVQKTVLSKSSAEPSQAIKRFSSQELAFACIMSPEKIAGLELTDTAEKVAEYLKQTSEIALSVRIAGQEMRLNGILSFKSDSDAADFVTIAKPFLSEIKSVAGAETPPNISVSGKDVDITIPVSISDAWDLISNLTTEHSEEELKGLELPQHPADK